jgi:hypothetical protein
VEVVWKIRWLADNTTKYYAGLLYEENGAIKTHFSRKFNHIAGASEWKGDAIDLAMAPQIEVEGAGHGEVLQVLSASVFLAGQLADTQHQVELWRKASPNTRELVAAQARIVELEQERRQVNTQPAAAASSPNPELQRLRRELAAAQEEIAELRTSLASAPTSATQSSSNFRTYGPTSSEMPLVGTISLSHFGACRDVFLHDAAFQGLFGRLERLAPTSSSTADSYRSFVWEAFQAWLKAAKNQAPFVHPDNWADSYLVDIGNNLLRYLKIAEKVKENGGKTDVAAIAGKLREQRAEDLDDPDAKFVQALSAGEKAKASSGRDTRKYSKAGNARAGQGNAGRNSSAPGGKRLH